MLQHDRARAGNAAARAFGVPGGHQRVPAQHQQPALFHDDLAVVKQHPVHGQHAAVGHAQRNPRGDVAQGPPHGGGLVVEHGEIVGDGGGGDRRPGVGGIKGVMILVPQPKGGAGEIAVLVFSVGVVMPQQEACVIIAGKHESEGLRLRVADHKAGVVDGMAFIGAVVVAARAEKLAWAVLPIGEIEYHCPVSIALLIAPPEAVIGALGDEGLAALPVIPHIVELAA